MRDEYTNQNQAGSALGRIDKTAIVDAKREKTWDECGIEEKVERIRRELLGVRDMGHSAYRNANEARELAARHQHSASGEVLRSAERSGGMVGAEGRGFDPLR